MYSISQITSKIINKRPFLLEMMSDGLINLTALARSIRSEVEAVTFEKVSIASIVMALKRYKLKIDSSQIGLENCIKQINRVMLVSNLVEFTFKNVSKSGEKQKQLTALVNSEEHSLLSYIKGMNELTIVSDRKYIENIQTIYSDDVMVDKSKNMSALILQLPPDNTDVPGLYYYIFRKLAWGGIPISEVVSTHNELTFLLKDKYIKEAFSLINELQPK